MDGSDSMNIKLISNLGDCILPVEKNACLLIIDLKFINKIILYKNKKKMLAGITADSTGGSTTSKTESADKILPTSQWKYFPSIEE